MRKLFDTLLRWELEFFRWFNRGRLTKNEWETLFQLRREADKKAGKEVK